MMDAKTALYNQLILEHNKKPRNYKELSAPDRQAEGINPLCGDHIWVYLNLADGAIADIGFQGRSCAICQASASIMTTQVKGKPASEAEQLVRDFRSLIVGAPEHMSPANKDNRYFQAFSGIANLPSRVKCAVLPWHTLHSALENRERATTEGAEDPMGPQG